MKRKIVKYEKFPKLSLLLLNTIIILKGVFFKYKRKKNFIVPYILIKYINDNNISIQILVNYEYSDILEINSIISVNIETCRLMDEFGFSYYLEFFG